MSQYGTLIRERWNERETFEYAYDTNAKDDLFGCLAKLRQRLFVPEFTVVDEKIIYSTQ